MSDILIEKLLWHAPQPSAPADLLQRLQSEIVLPQTAVSNGRQPEIRPRNNPLRRWIPALAFGLFLLTCLVLVGVQAVWINQTNRENERLQAAAADLPRLRAVLAELENTRVLDAELERLRQDRNDLQRLRAEVAQLQETVGQMDRLRAENQQLSTSLMARGSGAAFMEEARKEAERITCINNLKQIGLAARIWFQDEGRYPSSLVVMSNEIDQVSVLICPSDEARRGNRSVSWNDFRDDMSSYVFTARPDDDGHPTCIISECPFHRHYGLADGSVQSPPHSNIVTRDGRRYLGGPQ